MPLLTFNIDDLTLSFGEFCHRLYDVCQENETVQISVPQDEATYQKLLNFISFAKEQQINHVIVSNLIFEWAIVLLHFAHGEGYSGLIEQTTQKAVEIEDHQRLPSVLATLSHLPDLTDPKDITVTLNILLPILIESRKNQQVLPPLELSKAFYHFKNVHHTDEIVESVLEELLWHVEENIKASKGFNAVQWSEAFYGLHQLQGSTLPRKFLAYFQKYVPQNQSFDGRQLAMLMQGVQNIPANEVEEFFEKIAAYIIRLTEQNKPIDLIYGSEMLGALHNMQENEAINNFLLTIIDHLKSQLWSMRDIDVALYGLKNLASSPIAHKMVTLIGTSFSVPGKIPEKTYLQAWFANLVHHLDAYFDQPESQSTAIEFLSNVRNLLISNAPTDFDRRVVNFDPRAFIGKETRIERIIKLGGFIDGKHKRVNLIGYRCSMELIDVISHYSTTQGGNWKINVESGLYTKWQTKEIRKIFPSSEIQIIEAKNRRKKRQASEMNHADNGPLNKRPFLPSQSFMELKTDESWGKSI